MITLRRWLRGPRHEFESAMTRRVRELAAGLGWRAATDVVHREFREKLAGEKPPPYAPPVVPAPVVRGREGVPGDPMPRALAGWRRAAEATGWTCRVVYSRGWALHLNGEPKALVDAVSLRMRRSGADGLPGELVERAVALWHDGSAAEGWYWIEGATAPARAGHTMLKAMQGLTKVNGKGP